MNISVIIPVYNGAKTICCAIDSVLKQKINEKYSCDLEVIVVNDGSTDNTLDVVIDYIKSNSLTNVFIFTTENKGVSNARNYAINKAKYDWIAFLDSDDKWNDDKLNIQLEYINGINPPPDLIGSARNSETLSLYGKKIDNLYHVRLRDLFIKMFPQTSTAIVRKEILYLCGAYDVEMTHCEDADLWIRICAYRNRFYYHPESTVITGGGKENYGSSGLSANLPKMEAGMIRMLKKSYHRQDICITWYLSLFIFYKIKYIRRLSVVLFRRVKCYLN